MTKLSPEATIDAIVSILQLNGEPKLNPARCYSPPSNRDTIFSVAWLFCSWVLSMVASFVVTGSTDPEMAKTKPQTRSIATQTQTTESESENRDDFVLLSEPTQERSLPNTSNPSPSPETILQALVWEAVSIVFFQRLAANSVDLIESSSGIDAYFVGIFLMATANHTIWRSLVALTKGYRWTQADRKVPVEYSMVDWSFWLLMCVGIGMVGWQWYALWVTTPYAMA